MPDNDRNPFAFDDFFVQDYVATVEKVEFTSNDYGRLQAVFNNRYAEPIVGDDGQTRTSRTEWYTVGSSDLWVPIEDGTAFEHSSGDVSKRLRSDSGYGKLLMRCSELMGEEYMLSKGKPEMFAAGMYSAAPWLDEQFHWVTEGAGEKWENKKSGEKGVTKGLQMPVEWLGGSGAIVSGPSSNGYDVAGIGLDESTLYEMVTQAKGLSHGEFQSKSIAVVRDLQDAGVRSKLTAALGDKSFYETLRASEEVL